jgi:predicted RNase H-like HicB family nuclease
MWAKLSLGSTCAIFADMKFLITMFQDEDGVYVAECPSIPGCISQGRTEAEAEQNIQQAIRECLEVRAEKGMPLTVTTRHVEVPV